MAENDTRFIFMLDETEKRALVEMSHKLQSSQAETLRRLIRGAASQFGIVMVNEGAANEPANA